MSVLVAEDEPIILAGLVIELEAAGFAVIASGDGQEALHQFEDHPEVSAVFTDINMPGPLDGLSLANIIAERRPDVRLVLTSGRNAPVKVTMPAGACFLPKPYNGAELAELLDPASSSPPRRLTSRPISRRSSPTGAEPVFVLPELPYAYEALEPVMSARTLHFHYDKHHAGYVKTLNSLLQAAGRTPATLESLILDASDAGEPKLFNNAAQAWNHSFFWQSMSAAPQAPEGDLAAAIDAAFGDLSGLQRAFVDAGVGHFGSGWVWLTADRDGGLALRTTHDAECALTQAEATPLLVCDVWEHAYYLDRQNDRKAYLTDWFDALPNWGFAAAQLTAARGGGTAWRFPVPATAA